MKAKKISCIFFHAIFIVCIIFMQCTTTQTVSGEYEYVPPVETEKPAETKERVPVTGDIPAVKPETESLFTIQIFASQLKEVSEQEAEKIRAKVIQPVIIKHTDGYYKVQVGNYSERREVERVKDEIKNLGYSDAFIVYNPQARLFMENQTEPAISSEYYTVQILASQNRDEARHLLKNVIDLKFEEAFIVFEESLWKVRIGRYNTKEQAVNGMNRLKNIGFVDSWIVTSTK